MAKILVVDDVAENVDFLAHHLHKAGYEVVSADNGQAALEVAQAQCPDVILLDIMMPEMNGIEVCRRLKADPELHSIPVVMVSANDQEDDIIAALDAGAQDYITKPVRWPIAAARVRSAVRIKSAHDTIAEQRDYLEDALARLQEAHAQLLQTDKMASIGQLAAGVAHEINNPIGFISSNLNSLGQYVDDLKRLLAAYDELARELAEGRSDMVAKADKVRGIRNEVDTDFLLSDITDLIAESVDGTQRVRKIVADLRDFSHVDAPDVSEEDINNLLDQTISVAWNELKYKTEVVREYGDIPIIPCFGGKIGQVFLNLLVNAAQAIEKRGTITVRTGAANDHVWIEVSDTGRGIPPENLKRVFDPFFTTKEIGKGTGMGLHLAYKIIEAHGGSINVEGTVGKGSTFHIELPITGPPEVKETQNESVA